MESTTLETLETGTLIDKLEEAIEIDTEETDIPEYGLNRIRIQNVCDTIAGHLAEVGLEFEPIEETTLQYGSGDTGRQSQLYLQPYENVEKEELREFGEKLNLILEEIFPSKYYLGIRHNYTVNDEGYSEETEVFTLFLVYQVRSHGDPSKPSGESTEILN